MREFLSDAPRAIFWIVLSVFLAWIILWPTWAYPYDEIDQSTPPPAGWPSLEVKTIDGDNGIAGIQRNCGPSTPQVTRWGCSVPNFKQGTCLIFIKTRDPDLIAHESLHCRGYSHVGTSWAKDQMEYWIWSGWKS